MAVEQDVAAAEAPQSPCAHAPVAMAAFAGMPIHPTSSRSANFQALQNVSGLSCIDRKPRGKRKGTAKSPAAEGAAKQLARTPSRRIGVLTDEELHARSALELQHVCIERNLEFRSVYMTSHLVEICCRDSAAAAVFR